MATELCWICGALASTGEHLSKRSDLRSLFGTPSQSDPIYFHTAKRRNKRVGSLDAKILKSSSRLCNRCNSARTQKHDRAWQHFSETLRAREYLLNYPYIRANAIFPYATRRAMLNLHLYWLKILGCAVMEGGIAIDIEPIANCILNERAHPNVHLAFGWMHLPVWMAGASDVKVAMLDQKCAYLTRFHNVGNLAINLIYAIKGEKRQGLTRAWHPYLGAKRLKLTDFDADPV
jgi:hypothetical protein